VVLKFPGQKTGSQVRRKLFNPRQIKVQRGLDTDAVSAGPHGDIIPFCSLLQQWGIAGHDQGHDGRLAAQGDVRRAALEFQRTAGRRARPFREHDERVALPQGLGPRGDDALGIAVGHVTGGAHHAPEKEAVVDGLLHHAGGLPQQRNDQDHIEIAGMIGQEQLALQGLGIRQAIHFQKQNAAALQSPDEGLEKDVDHPSASPLTGPGASRRQPHEGHDHQGEQDPAHPQGREQEPAHQNLANQPDPINEHAGPKLAARFGRIPGSAWTLAKGDRARGDGVALKGS